MPLWVIWAQALLLYERIDPEAFVFLDANYFRFDQL